VETFGGPRRLRAGFLGRVGYRDAFGLQELCRDALLSGEGDETLLLLEHPPVFTLGRSADPADVVAGAEWLRGRGIEVVETDRGGQVTYHGPGQLVGYPILNLHPDRRDLRRYVRDLQEVLVDTLRDFGIAARGGEGEGIGVWVEERGVPAKLASIGVHLRRWVTTHGFALNVEPELENFGGIVACGMPDVRMTSMHVLTGGHVPLDHVAGACMRHLAARFDRELVPLGWNDLPAVAPALVGGGKGP
jgi:lipoyl(octanoyl) transferase